MFKNFKKEINIDKNIDTSNVTDMSYMFSDATLANPDTRKWDVSNVTNMKGMFDGAISANPDTSGWDVSRVTNMTQMFLNSAYTGEPL